MSEIAFRSFADGDEAGIIDLFYNVAPYGGTIDYWRWMNREGPFGQSIVELMVADDKPVGHYAVAPMRLCRKAKEIKAGWAMQVCIHRNYRGMGNLRSMCDRVWKAGADAGMDFIYGFPNQRIWPIYDKLMEWRLISHFPALQYPFAEDGKPELRSDPSEIEVHETTSFGDEFDNLWVDSDVAESDMVSIRRTADYLSWRYTEHPNQHYKILAARSGELLVGYTVLKFYHDGEQYIGHFTDLLMRKSYSDEAARALLRAGFEIFDWQQVDRVSMWLSSAHPARAIVEDIGFSADGFRSRLGLRPTSDQIPATLTSLAGWNIGMGDSDVF